ncbi:DMP19 family protein [Neisseria weaveri]|uniref:DNA mimic protein DMP19 C-terminal domain-containing protein n=1 Tax=Neisseria weaveri TaxID=28091 RepID=A0A448VJE1_9NEIS|nr:DMP19 family protein [Neisseria weaveri]EGV35381.1 hypothetical protein l11_20370 [Neisseria weaveri LMG 5135]EGV35917.1 hypothetical protein l13_12570 [Neisseria weaveri ATCC 51223]SAY51203.1 Uncharacterised protein [Neisseria weaveri]VEJ49886.1 Uncharacterised protein [Neisseria weaveri]
MKLNIKKSDFSTPDQFVYTLADAYFDYLEQHGDAAMDDFTDEQHTLMAYVYLDSQVQEGGFIQLISAGYGEYIFMNPVADSLRRWRIKQTPKILEQAKKLYEKYGQEIETMAENDTPLEEVRKQFTDFEETDGDYYDVADDDLAAAAEYIEANPDKFMNIG